MLTEESTTILITSRQWEHWTEWEPPGTLDSGIHIWVLPAADAILRGSGRL